ncbi:O-acetyltransferase [Secundilactobacillus pentosiphilus]|uniref:O-acetyltransferase n=2 Tax=Secundilactobacillus pentosiphilus TaxID=1714682 RepID=A0A1Z5IMQ2_9LACO|nr:O-acetyltransferase [Secundilactobacillus pentosiphilus]
MVVKVFIMNFTQDSKPQYLSANNDDESNQQPAPHKRRRIVWLDIAKGIGMVAVVCGHNLLPYVELGQVDRYWYNFIYWWHMPLFFLISGFFLRSINLVDIERVTVFFKKKVLPILRSYFVAGLLLIIAYKFIHNKSITYSLVYVLKLFYGGKTLGHYTTIFWYPETYILGIIGTTVIISLIRFKPLQLVIAAYFIYWSTSYVQETKFQFLGVVTAPWDMDIAVLVMAYMLIGYNLFYFCKHYLVKWYVFLPSAAAVYWLFVQLKTEKFSFILFMRSHQITASFDKVPATHIQLALMVGIIPILCCLAVFGISRMIAFPLKFTHSAAKVVLFPVQLIARILSLTGKHTLIIMYMHKMILDILRTTQATSLFWMQVFIATAVPLLIGIAFKQWQRLRAHEWQGFYKSLKAKQQENDKW